jgi:membrane glycosyltransferase
MIENAQRDRRWCQGNLQHGLVLFARGLRGISRIHLLLGIFGYLASPLWLLFLLTFNWDLWFKGHTGLSAITVSARTPFITLTGTEHAFLIFAICMTVIFLPKILALLDLALHRRRRLAFGGLRHAVAGALVETVFSTLHAPLQMLWHSTFVATILLGVGVHWGPQRRTADGIAWSQAFRKHWGHTALGLVWGAAVWRIDPFTFWWFAPVVAGMVLSIPLSVYTSRSGWGERARAWGLFRTPEELSPPPELAVLRARMAALEETGETVPRPPGSGLAEAVLDPYVSAIHVSLLLERRHNPDYSEALDRLGVGKPFVRALAETLLSQGPEALKPEEKLLVLSDGEIVNWLHSQAWLRPGETLAPWWQAAIREYAR